MLALVSPSKRLDFESNTKSESVTQPLLLDETEQLVDKLKDFSQSELEELMSISEKLGELNHQRYQSFSTPFTSSNARPAIEAFQGDTYVGLEAETLTADDISFAQDHLGMLSGLYGFLRPLDLMQAYRLEMGTNLSNSRGDNLYDFWGDRITEVCNKILSDHSDKTTISLASNEYIKSVNTEKLNGPFITCHFKEVKNDKPKVIAIYAKRARGTMARYIIQNRVNSADELKNFKEDGYQYSDDLSDQNNLVFLRQS